METQAFTYDGMTLIGIQKEVKGHIYLIFFGKNTNRQQIFITSNSPSPSLSIFFFL